MKTKISFAVCLTLCVAMLAVSAAADTFPGRSVYFYVPVIEIAELQANFERYHVIDVRTRYEYDTLRMQGARHVDLDNPEFVKRVKEIHAQDPRKKVVFYCRGHSCFMSYQAVEKMRRAGFQEAISFDAGIFDWAYAHPESTALFGRAPITRSDLIDLNRFKSHLLSPEDFAKRAHDQDTVILDIRRAFEREGISLFVNRETNIEAEKSEVLEPFLEQVKRDGRTLMVYDISGHEIKTFQYTLESKGIDSYYFMQGGAKRFYDEVIR